MKGTQNCINKVIKAIKVVQHLGDGSSSKTKAEKKSDDIFDLEESPRPSHEGASSKNLKWAVKCIRAGGKGKASADRLLKSAKGRTLSQVLTSRRLEPPSYANAHHGHPSSTVVGHQKPPHSNSTSSSKSVKSDPPIHILMWIGDQHIDIGKTLVPY